MVRELRQIVDTTPRTIELPDIPAFQYQKTLADEVAGGTLTRACALDLLEVMLMTRAFEEMIARIDSQQYPALPDFQYIGPTHVSIGQEGIPGGAVAALGATDYITSSHRGHGDAIAKGYFVIKGMGVPALRAYLDERSAFFENAGLSIGADDDHEALVEKALRLHLYRTIAELFGKADGYCRGVGGSMHIADFAIDHLGANAIVGGHMAIATGAGISARYRENGRVCLCLAGDGAYGNGISHEAINVASMAQFHNGIMKRAFGVPVIFAIINNQYGMSGQQCGETTGVDCLARRGAAYHVDALHAEIVDGMNILAVIDATKRAVAIAREGHGPVLLEFMTYRFVGHTLHDPAHYRDREELAAWRRRDAISQLSEQLVATPFDDPVTPADIDALKARVEKRNEDLTVRAANSPAPAPETLLDHMYSTSTSEIVPQEFAHVTLEGAPPTFQRDADGCMNYRAACTEALVEEMRRDSRVVLLGEDIGEYGGAFGVTRGLLEAFGRERVFNTSISESAIIGAAVGMAMTGLRPIPEIMYCDFILQAMDQLGNQAAKWGYMSGGQISVSLVMRTAIGGGRGYAGQHSQSLETVAAHIPGLVLVMPSDAYDAKGLLKSSIRDDNPVCFFEHQQLYNTKCPVPEQEYLIPLGKANVKREAGDVTVVAWGLMVLRALEAAEELQGEGISLEVVDLRTLWPLDVETLVASVAKTGRCVVAAQPVEQASYAAYVAARIQEEAFDYLDAPVLRLGSANGVSPTAQSLETVYLPDAEKLIETIRRFY